MVHEYKGNVVAYMVKTFSLWGDYFFCQLLTHMLFMSCSALFVPNVSTDSLFLL